MAVIAQSGHPDRILLLMRLGILPFFWLFCLVVFLWTRHHFGRLIAVLATALATLVPTVLAHAGLATTDMPFTACVGAAFLALMLWVEKPTVRNALLLGAATALAMLAKFTTVVYLPLPAAVMLAWFLVSERPGAARLAALVKERAPTFAVAVLTGATGIWAGYLFSFGMVQPWQMRLPAPEFFHGILTVLNHNAMGHYAYLLGRNSQFGWWYFFPVALAVKTPLPFLGLLGVGLYLCWRNRAQMRYRYPAVFALSILVFSMTGSINIGVRHILPVYMGFSIVAALGLEHLLRLAPVKKWAVWTSAVLLLWLAAGGAIAHPDYIAYFNELAAAEPENVLVDSDLDWGQDMKRLARRLQELGVQEIHFTGSKTEYWPGLPKILPMHPVEPNTGWTVVSLTPWKTAQFGLYHKYPGVVPWIERLQPVERVGTLRLYYIAPGTLRRVR
jgi:4-amino-4-deoxy-L-arabinose transferase-like glycosyltransferase